MNKNNNVSMPVLSTEKVQAAVDMARKGRIIVLGEGALCNPSNADLFGGLTPTDERAAKKTVPGLSLGRAMSCQRLA